MRRPLVAFFWTPFIFSAAYGVFGLVLWSTKFYFQNEKSVRFTEHLLDGLTGLSVILPFVLIVSLIVALLCLPFYFVFKESKLEAAGFTLLMNGGVG